MRYCRFQSTRPSRASTHDLCKTYYYTTISIHKALAGLDSCFMLVLSKSSKFQSTRPSRASTLNSIRFPPFLDFNPQGPRGPRPHPGFLPSLDSSFQSTRPSRASTSLAVSMEQSDRISIHKALAGLDEKPNSLSILVIDFNPQGPRGPRPISYPPKS